jgi:hypothetical protein
MNKPYLPAQLISPRELAQRFKISLREIQSWRPRKIGPRYYRLSYAVIRYDPADVAAWLKKQAHYHEQKSGSEVRGTRKAAVRKGR